MLASVHKPSLEQDLDRGPAADKDSARERFCALTRAARPVDELIRFVVGPDGNVVPDLKRKLPGRGLWISATRAAVTEAGQRNIFARGFKRDVRVDPDLANVVDTLLARSALDALAIAGKAGQVVQGFAKVETAITRGEAVALIEAADGADDGKRKMGAVLASFLRQKTDETPREIPVIGVFSSGQLDLALNRLNVVHAALLAGPVSDTFVARTKRFERFRTGILTNTAPMTDATAATADLKAD